MDNSKNTRSSTDPPPIERYIADSVHGDIALTSMEREIIVTPSFQRLRHLKQLGMGHATYPNATHTRFAHSLGVLAIMSKVLRVAGDKLNLSREQAEDLRLAALLHDIGHYPYSHLMEKVDKVRLTEERIPVAGKRKISVSAASAYPDHEMIGQLILTHQSDLREILHPARAERVANLFTRSETADPQLSKLIHSSLDMDRLDYLVRDAMAAGVPYGSVAIDYLLNCVRVSDSGMIGIKKKALTAAEQFLFARYFMHKTVYFHKTTFGLDECFRQLIRRCRDNPAYGLPQSGEDVEAIVKNGAQLMDFTDAYLDRVARKATADEDNVIRRLARAIVHRKPPRLLSEQCELIERSKRGAWNVCRALLELTRARLPNLAEQYGIPVGLFLIAEPPRVSLEKRGSLLSPGEAAGQEDEQADELIKIFSGDSEEPVSLVDIPESLINHAANHELRIARLYVVENDSEKVSAMREEVEDWFRQSD